MSRLSRFTNSVSGVSKVVIYLGVIQFTHLKTSVAFLYVYFYMSQFAVAFDREIGAHSPKTEKWELLRDTMQRTALATFGKKDLTDS